MSAWPVVRNRPLVDHIAKIAALGCTEVTLMRQFNVCRARLGASRQRPKFVSARTVLWDGRKQIQAPQTAQFVALERDGAKTMCHLCVIRALLATLGTLRRPQNAKIALWESIRVQRKQLRAWSALTQRTGPIVP